MDAQRPLSAKRFLSEWGHDDFTRLPREEAGRSRLSAASAEFLIEAGLPKRTVLLLEFNLDRGLEPFLWSHKLDRFLRFGSDEGSVLCFDVSDGQSVKSLRADRDPVLVNASIQQLAFSLLEYRRYSERVRSVGDEDAQIDVARQFKKTLSQLDPTVEQNPDSWWARIAAQAIDGLL